MLFQVATMRVRSKGYVIGLSICIVMVSEEVMWDGVAKKLCILRRTGCYASMYAELSIFPGFSFLLLVAPRGD
jgi:hypothetical protein